MVRIFQKQDLVEQEYNKEVKEMKISYLRWSL